MEYEELPHQVCDTLLIELFQSIPELLQKTAPNGFNNSPLVQVYHPLPEQQYKEYRYSQMQVIRMQRTLQKRVMAERTKSYSEFVQLEPTPVDEQYEIALIFGKCIWDIFSNNHTVYNEDGGVYDLGSWRDSGSIIADIINRLDLVPGVTFDYLDFYMGHFRTAERADLTPVYEFIFTKLKARELDWEYSFPSVSLIDLDTNENKEETQETYDATTAVQKQLEQQQKEEELNRLQHKLDESYNKEFEKARYSKPRPEVMAYYNVYGHWPYGHPLSECGPPP
jgi:hypothetical protein